MKASRSSKKTSGFTLVELIVVLVILATLAALLVPSLTGYIDKARQNAVIAKARTVLVASQAVVTEAYADGKLVLDTSGELYMPPDPKSAIAHTMAKEIMALAEITEDECEWRIYIVSPIEEEYAALATILQLAPAGCRWAASCRTGRPRQNRCPRPGCRRPATAPR